MLPARTSQVKFEVSPDAADVLGTVVWVLGIVGFHHWWLEYAWEGTALLVALLVLVVRWVWRRVRGVDAAAP